MFRDILTKRNDLSNHESSWFEFYVQPNCEKTANQRMVNQGMQAFLPLKIEPHRRKWTETPLFNSWVFAKIKREDYFNHIKSINKFIKVVDIGGEVYSIQEEEISWLKEIYSSWYPNRNNSLP